MFSLAGLIVTAWTQSQMQCTSQFFFYSFDHRLVSVAAFICHCMDWYLRILLSISHLFLNSSDTFCIIFSVLLQRRPPILLAVRMMTSLKHNMYLMFPQRLSLFSIFFMTTKKRALQSRNCINFRQICTPPFTFTHLHPVPTINAKGRWCALFVARQVVKMCS